MKCLVETDVSLPARFLFEWLSPPFDAGHWMPDMMQWACVEHATTKPSKSDRKSKDATSIVCLNWCILQGMCCRNQRWKFSNDVTVGFYHMFFNTWECFGEPHFDLT